MTVTRISDWKSDVNTHQPRESNPPRVEYEHIPKWFFRMHAVFVPLIAGASIGAAGLLWTMQIELTTLNVEVKHLNASLPELDRIRERMHGLETQLATLTAKTEKLRVSITSQGER